MSLIMPRYKCNRCFGPPWIPRGDKEPQRCPHCNSRYWNKPRVRKWPKDKRAKKRSRNNA